MIISEKYNRYACDCICDECGKKYRANYYRAIKKEKQFCMSCSIKLKWKEPEFKQKSLKTRQTKEYKENMSKSVKSSEKYKAKRYIINKAIKEYWKKVRGGKDLDEVYDEWELYKKIVYKMTEVQYRKFKEKINPNNLERGHKTYHVDHKFSVLEGFKHNIPPYIISNRCNLQMLKAKENISKDFRCSISKDELYTEVFRYLKI